MSAEPVPIRPGVQPELDPTRELMDFVHMKMTAYERDQGCAPTVIALMLSGEHPDGKRASIAVSWDSAEKRTRLETCSLASALFTKRAIENED